MQRITLRLTVYALGLMASAGLGALLPDVAGSTMLPLSILLGAALLGILRPSRSAIPTDRNLRILAVPLVTALLTLVLLAATREYYSGRYLALFTVIWTSWMLIGRTLLARTAPKPRLLLAHPTARWHDLLHADIVDVTPSEDPPADVSPWDGVVIDLHTRYDDAWLAWLAAANAAGVPTLDARTLTEVISGRVDLTQLGDTLTLSGLARDDAYTPFKRFLDVAVTLLLLPLLLPLALLLSLAILLQDGAPILFRQARVGRNGVPFTLLKFRTMREIDDAGTRSVPDAERVTPLGRILRRVHLDELPQFWNVLRGDMSLVGPRPERVDFVEQYAREIALFPLRHGTRPGITGWAQVSRGYTLGVQGAREKLSYDFYYVKHRSAWFDLRILFRTVPAIVRGAGSKPEEDPTVHQHARKG